MTVISEPTKALLKLSDKPGIGAGALRKVIEDGLRQGPARSFSHWFEGALRIVGPEGTVRTKKERFSEVVDQCARLDIQIFSPFDQGYPPLLRLIRDFPPIIYVKGNSDTLTTVACAVVGTRQASQLGTSWARQIAEILADKEVTVVSGLALGIDTAAHEGALKKQGKTVAILAHGLDQVTPSSNRDLARNIVSSGGALMSEHPPGVPPRRAEYVRRNRLQCGMSVGSIVVESGREGGAIHQARFTKDQQRELFTVIPPPDTPGAEDFNAEGPHLLIQEMKARVLQKRDDLDALLRSAFFSKRFADLMHTTETLRLL